MTSILNRTKKHTTKDVKQLAHRAERIIRDLDSPDVKQLRKDAGKLARDVRAHAVTVRERTAETALTAKSSARAHTPSRKELEQRREDIMEKVVATAGVILPLIPSIARTAVTHKNARRAAMVAPKVAARSNPIVLGVSVASAGFLGYRVWKRHLAKQTAQAARDERHQDFVVNRMEGEGGNLGGYDSEPPSLSSVGTGTVGSRNGFQ